MKWGSRYSNSICNMFYSLPDTDLSNWEVNGSQHVNIPPAWMLIWNEDSLGATVCSNMLTSPLEDYKSKTDFWQVGSNEFSYCPTKNKAVLKKIILMDWRSFSITFALVTRSFVVMLSVSEEGDPVNTALVHREPWPQTHAIIFNKSF